VWCIATPFWLHSFAAGRGFAHSIGCYLYELTSDWYGIPESAQGLFIVSEQISLSLDNNFHSRLQKQIWSSVQSLGILVSTLLDK
jgi:hypothetical protein